MSFAQFRPEKQHELQLKIWQKAKSTGKIPDNAELWMVGACRGPDDEEIVSNLKLIAKDM